MTDAPATLERIARVCVLGNIASGKSFLASRISDALGLPIAHLDQLYWRPGWSHVSRAEFLTRQRELLAEDRWIIDGTFSEFGLDDRFRRADAVVFLDVGATTCLRRALARRGDRRTDLPDGADDTALGPGRAASFLAEIALFGVWDRPRILRAARRNHARFFHLTSWNDEPDVLAALRAA